MNLKHRKKRNTALVYEFLVRRMASTMVDRDPDSYLKALEITKRYYGAGQPLAVEKSLFDAIVQNRGVSGQAASRILQDVQRHARGTDQRLLEIKKSNLIKDVNYAFGLDFFDVHRIREYRLLASIQMLLDRYRNPNAPLNEDVEKIHLEESLVKYMTSNPTQVTTQAQPVDSLVASLAMRKFEERYSGVLSEGQRLTLRRFMNYTMTGDRDRFEREMKETIGEVVTKLSAARNTSEFTEDKVMEERLTEAFAKIGEIATGDVTTESAVQDVLLYQRLTAEIDSDA